MQARWDAARLGHKTYTTGKPCKRGHESLRYTSTGICVFCNRQRAVSARTAFINESWGFKAYTFIVHGDDIEKLEAYAKTLEMARKLQEGKI